MAATARTALLAHDDTGGSGPLVVLLPGAGDLRSEHRFLTPALAGAGYRVVTADLPGHGDSAPTGSYGVAETADAVLDLIDHLAAGPAAVVACSFAPAATLWAAAERPEAFSGLVMISPHLEADESPSGSAQRLAITALLRGPWAGALWHRLYRSWYPAGPPADLDDEVDRIREMLSDPARRKAVRQTLTASRDGMGERISTLDTRSLVIFGTADSHFADPAAEAASIAERTGASTLLVDGAGHYPHVERPEPVITAILEFLGA